MGQTMCHVLYTYSLEGSYLCEDIQTDCDDEGTTRSHDLCHRTLELDTSLPSYLNRKWEYCDDNELEYH